MPHKESLYPTDWLRIAEKDWKRVKQLLEADLTEEDVHKALTQVEGLIEALKLHFKR